MDGAWGTSDRLGSVLSRGYPINTEVYGRDYRFLFGLYEANNEIYRQDGTNYTARFWQYDSRVGRRWNVDPMTHLREWLSPYNFVQNNPINRIDPTGALDGWYRTNDGTVLYDENIKSQQNLVDAGIDGTYLSENKYDKVVSDAIGSDIMNTAENCIESGWNKFIDYYENKDLGTDYFMDVSQQNYNENATGFVAFALDKVSGARESLVLSMMTHDWVGDVTLDFTGNKNRIEHNIGMFLVAQKHGPGTASLIGNLNEARGLIINDRQNGNMWNAVLGRGGTALEWSDLRHNSEGLSRWSSYIGIEL